MIRDLLRRVVIWNTHKCMCPVREYGQYLHPDGTMHEDVSDYWITCNRKATWVLRNVLSGNGVRKNHYRCDEHKNAALYSVGWEKL